MDTPLTYAEELEILEAASKIVDAYYKAVDRQLADRPEAWLDKAIVLSQTTVGLTYIKDVMISAGRHLTAAEVVSA